MRMSGGPDTAQVKYNQEVTRAVARSVAAQLLAQLPCASRRTLRLRAVGLSIGSLAQLPLARSRSHGRARTVARTVALAQSRSHGRARTVARTVAMRLPPYTQVACRWFKHRLAAQLPAQLRAQYAQLRACAQPIKERPQQQVRALYLCM